MSQLKEQYEEYKRKATINPPLSKVRFAQLTWEWLSINDIVKRWRITKYNRWHRKKMFTEKQVTRLKYLKDYWYTYKEIWEMYSCHPNIVYKYIRHNPYINEWTT